MGRFKILIPLDGSTWSRQVLPQVRRLFNRTDYEIILLRAADEPQPVAIEPVTAARVEGMYWPDDHFDRFNHAPRSRRLVYASQLWERTETRLKDELEDDATLLRVAGYAVKVAVRFGDPAEEIVAFARHNGVDLIVMATHGRTGLKRFVLGSVAEQIVRELQIPVMLVRPSDDAAEEPDEQAV